jgi:prophage DNA circulation protein
VQGTYVDPRLARQARADVAEFFDYAMTALDGWKNYAVYAELANLRRLTVQHLSQTITTLAPILNVKATNSMPSLWWANYLYGDANRATELVERNAVILPSFMPAEFEALSK